MNFVLNLTENQVDAILDYYKDKRLNTQEAHVLARIKTARLVITVYRSNKVMFQGSDAEHEALFWEETFGLKKTLPKEKTRYPYYYASIGSDESGAGDYFGPMTVCAVAITKSDIAFLKTLNIKDSKALSDKEIKVLAPKLTAKLKYSLNVLDNERYNALIGENYNLNKFKAYLHAQCHLKLIEKVDQSLPVVIDQFCSKDLYKKYLSTFKDYVLPDIFMTKAESHFASVAAASIIARYAFLTNLEKLGLEYHVVLHKGASERVNEQARTLVEDYGETILNKITKKHFKNTEKVIG